MDIARIAEARYTTKAFDPVRKISPEKLAALRTLLRNTPSSVNSQPWHFVFASTDAGKAQIAKATHGDYAYNAPKVQNASHVVVLCAKTTLDNAHLKALIDQEDLDGRYSSVEAKENQDKVRRFYVELHQKQYADEPIWISKQVYIALGALLLGAGSLEIDACPMEGFDVELLDEELGLKEKGLTALLIVALGYHSNEDFNASLSKSRLPETLVFSDI